MDKLRAKLLWQASGLPTPACEVLRADSDFGAPASMVSNGSAGSTAAVPMSQPSFDAEGAAAQELPPDLSNEQFTDVGTNPFVLVAHDPFSTFAADVDTASYDIFRRDVNLGLAPQLESVRVEDFVNYFRYDYPAPAQDAEHPFTISLALGANPYGRDTTLLRVGIQATSPSPLEKKPANIVFLVDTSGSMQTAEKLPMVQYLLKQTLDVLDAADVVSIVTYAGDVNVRLEPTPIARREEIAAAIDGLTTNGGTNGAGGIQLAYQQAESAFIEDGINHVVLCTDGDFNIGVSSDEELVSLIEEKRTTGVTLTTLGFGFGNLNDSMMEKVSNAGNGMYSVITSETQATRYAEERMLATMIHVAKDMKIQVELNPDAVVAYRLIGYEDRAIADDDFRDDVVDAGEVGAGHRVTALYELVLAGHELPEVEGTPATLEGDAVEGAREIAEGDLVRVKVRYKQPGAAEQDPAAEVAQSLASDTVAASADALDADFAWAVAIAGFAEVLKGSPYADSSQLDAIGAVFAAQAERDADREEFNALFTHARTLIGE